MAVKMYLGERIFRCRNYAFCNFIGIPAVQTDQGFYCYDCASRHPDPEIRRCAEKFKLYRQPEEKPQEQRDEARGRRLRELIEYSAKSADLSKGELADLLGVSTRTLDKYIAYLKTIGIKITFKKEERKPSTKERAYPIIEKYPNITSRQLAERLGVSISTARDLIKQIKQEQHARLTGLSC